MSNNDIEEINKSTFNIDEASSDDQYLYVDVAGKGTVVIKNENEGILVDIFPLHVVDEPITSTYAFTHELMGESI
jgi:hypothetical protein